MVTLKLKISLAVFLGLAIQIGLFFTGLFVIGQGMFSPAKTT
jgi:hypothetical protein